MYGRVVRRGDDVDPLHGLDDLGRDSPHAAEGAAVDRLEGDGRDFRRVFQTARLRIGQLRQAKADSLGVVGDAERPLLPPVADLQRATALGRADPLDAAAASCRWASMSNSRCLKLVEPRLATSIFMESFHDRLASPESRGSLAYEIGNVSVTPGTRR